MGRENIAFNLKKGMALVFFHSGFESPLHEGPTPDKGRKYVLRSDVMYRKKK